MHNARIIEDGRFLQALNKWFTDFAVGRPQILATDDDYAMKVAQAKALAFEVNRRIAFRDGAVGFKLEIVEKGDEKGIERFNRVVETIKHKDETIEAGREYVEAYVDFMHYLERLYSVASKSVSHHDEEPGEHH